MLTQNKRFSILLAIAASILMIPLIAMQFSEEVDWKLPDFLVMGFLLLGTAGAIEIILRRVKTSSYRLLLCAGVVLTLLIIWAELAVGIFGTPFAGS